MHGGVTFSIGAILMICSATPVMPASPPGNAHPELHAIADAVQAANLRDTDTRLVSFGTRSTLSDTHSATRGIGAARRWVKSRFEAIAKDCGGCIEVVTPSQVFTGPRMPKT